MTTISIIIITAACFFAAVLNLASDNRFRNKITGTCIAIGLSLGILFYGYGFAYKFGATPVAVLRALLATCRMFGGVNDLGTIEAAPLFAHGWVLSVFWLVHFMAFYATASATIATIGSKVLRRIRATLLRRGTLLMIYGVNEHALEYGRRQIGELHRSVVFIGNADASQESAVNGIGGVLERNGEEPDPALLRRLGVRPGKRRIEIATLHEDAFRNYVFANKLCRALEDAGISPDQTALLIQGVEEESGAWLASENNYGYGSVMCFNEYELAARLMVQKLPPCDTIRFDDQARARQDFTVLMIGFGRMGLAALEQLVMNGQFCASSFRADIFDKDAQNGILHGHELLKNYDIRFHSANGKSDALYAFLAERRNEVRYIVLCTGSEKENREIAWDLELWLKGWQEKPAIVQCTRKRLILSRGCGYDLEYQNIYASDALDIERIDRMAMAINHAYCTNSDKSALENWRACDYFSRMSSRASADFYPAVLKAAGKTERQVLDGEWPPEGEALENMAITEHLRWCAFHYVRGWHPMSEAEYAERADRYRAEKQEFGASRLRIGKDAENKRHACLLPWEDLDSLSDRENAVTGGSVDYKQMDRNNILVLPEILKALHNMPENTKEEASV